MARNKYPEKTVQKILEVAGELFMRNGYDHTSIDDIAKSCGVTKGAIYHHFSSKEELLVSMMEFYETDSKWFFEIKNNSQLTGLQKLQAIFYHELSDEKKIKIDAILQNGLKDPKIIAKQLELSIQTIAPLLEEIIKQGIQDQSIKTSQPKQVAEIMVILINIWINPGILPTTREETLEKVKFLNSLLRKLGMPIFDEKLDKLVETYLESLEK